MRYRKPKNYSERLNPYLNVEIIEPSESTKGKWQEIFGNNNPIYLEIGMGKGQFLMEHAKRNPNINFIGIEKIEPIILGNAQRLRESGLKNIKLASVNANFLETFFTPGELSRIYLNFSDPWPKKRNANRRLTHVNYLKKYIYVLKPNSEIHFKTDNKALFEFTIPEISKMKFEILEMLIDLHNQDIDKLDDRVIMTEYEAKFSQEGKPIYSVQVRVNDII